MRVSTLCRPSCGEISGLGEQGRFSEVSNQKRLMDGSMYPGLHTCAFYDALRVWRNVKYRGLLDTRLNIFPIFRKNAGRTGQRPFLIKIQRFRIWSGIEGLRRLGFMEAQHESVPARFAATDLQLFIDPFHTGNRAYFPSQPFHRSRVEAFVYRNRNAGSTTTRRRTVSPEGELYLQALLRETVDLTLEDLCARYTETYQVSVSPSTMHATLKHLKVTRKRTSHSAPKRVTKPCHS
jgi:hypothetical protein